MPVHVFSALSFQGDRIVSASADNTARVWDAATAGALVAFVPKRSGRGLRETWLSSCEYSPAPEGRLVLTGSSDGCAVLWDSCTGEEVVVYRGHTGPVCGGHERGFAYWFSVATCTTVSKLVWHWGGVAAAFEVTEASALFCRNPLSCQCTIRPCQCNCEVVSRAHSQSPFNSILIVSARSFFAHICVAVRLSWPPNSPVGLVSYPDQRREYRWWLLRWAPSRMHPTPNSSLGRFPPVRGSSIFLGDPPPLNSQYYIRMKVGVRISD